MTSFPWRKTGQPPANPYELTYEQIIDAINYWMESNGDHYKADMTDVALVYETARRQQLEDLDAVAEYIWTWLAGEPASIFPPDIAADIKEILDA